MKWPHATLRLGNIQADDPNKIKYLARVGDGAMKFFPLYEVSPDIVVNLEGGIAKKVNVRP